MKRNEHLKYRFDEQTGIFIRESEISVNWFISQVLKRENLQVTKISNDDIQTLLLKIDNLRMPDGKHSLIWLKEKLKEYFEMSNVKQGEEFQKLSERYRFIVEQIDFALARSKNLKEKMEIRKEEIKLETYKTPNNMIAKFE
jgi:hypothetical protein